MRKFKGGATRDSNKRNSVIAWVAGFYDGEGSVCCVTNNNNRFSRIQLSIGQKNLSNNEIADTLIKFHKIVGVGYIYKKTRIGKEINQHQYFVCKAVDVIKVLKFLWPYLGIQKRNQAKKALSLYKKGQSILLKTKEAISEI